MANNAQMQRMPRGLYMERGTLVYDTGPAPPSDVVQWIADDRKSRLEESMGRMHHAIKLVEYDFNYVCDIAPDRDGDGVLVQFMPQSRYRNTRNLPLNKYGAGPFCKFKIPVRFTQCGVYAVTAGADVRYIGECANLSKRFNMGYGNISPRNCFKRGQETNCRLNNLVRAAILEGEHLSLWFFPTRNYKAVELSLRRTLKPLWNRV